MSSIFSCVISFKDTPLGQKYRTNLWADSHSALSLELYGLVKKDLHFIRPSRLYSML